MARIFLNPPMMTLSGSFTKSDKYSYVTRNGKTFTRAKGQRTKPFSPKEQDAHARFRRAVDWANMVQRSDELMLTYTRLWQTSSIQCPTFRGWLIKYYYQHFQPLTSHL